MYDRLHSRLKWVCEDHRSLTSIPQLTPIINLWGHYKKHRVWWVNRWSIATRYLQALIVTYSQYYFLYYVRKVSFTKFASKPTWKETSERLLFNTQRRTCLVSSTLTSRCLTICWKQVISRMRMRMRKGCLQ